MPVPKCRICGVLLVRADAGEPPLFKPNCDCRSKLPTTDDEVKAYANAGFCDFVVILGPDEGDDPVPCCDIVPLADGGVAWLRGGKVARFRTAADELVAREFLENAKRIEP